MVRKRFIPVDSTKPSWCISCSRRRCIYDYRFENLMATEHIKYRLRNKHGLRPCLFCLNSYIRYVGGIYEEVPLTLMASLISGTAFAALVQLQKNKCLETTVYGAVQDGAKWTALINLMKPCMYWFQWQFCYIEQTSIPL